MVEVTPFFIASMVFVGVTACAIAIGAMLLTQQQRLEKSPDRLTLQELTEHEQEARQKAADLESAVAAEQRVRSKACSVSNGKPPPGSALAHFVSASSNSFDSKAQVGGHLDMNTFPDPALFRGVSAEASDSDSDPDSDADQSAEAEVKVEVKPPTATTTRANLKPKTIKERQAQHVQTPSSSPTTSASS
mmetsp:Transcript_24006/g.44545  ORF Transcript_24006/g.44545 Transcript_24006/m.44545 type:complete len:190 (-) Transcript_24006:5-574(-)